MTTDAWINETLYEGWGQRFRVSRELAHVRSKFQEIRVFETTTHGRVMSLDGIIQITERDEFVYQEMIAHVPLLMHPSPTNVLIIGAGDGGVLHRVLQHNNVQRAVMVEIDGEVLRLAKEFMPAISGDSWTDPRAEVLIADGIAYVEQAGIASFDVIIVDSTDPVGVGEVLFTDAFYHHCRRILTDQGVIVNQCGVPFMQSEELRETSERRAKLFPHVSAYVVAVPSYVGGFMTLGFAAKDYQSLILDVPALEAAALNAGILGTTHYWTPHLHVAAFSLPPYIAACLPGSSLVQF